MLLFWCNIYMNSCQRRFSVSTWIHASGKLSWIIRSGLFNIAQISFECPVWRNCVFHLPTHHDFCYSLHIHCGPAVPGRLGDKIIRQQLGWPERRQTSGHAREALDADVNIELDWNLAMWNVGLVLSLVYKKLVFLRHAFFPHYRYYKSSSPQLEQCLVVHRDLQSTSQVMSILHDYSVSTNQLQRNASWLLVVIEGLGTRLLVLLPRQEPTLLLYIGEDWSRSTFSFRYYCSPTDVY